MPVSKPGAEVKEDNWPVYAASEKPSFETLGADWPNRDASRFVEVGGLMFHIQEMGRGPDLLLLHGTGSATHSWRDLLPILAKDFRCLAVDLPGHGFSDIPTFSQLTLQRVARYVSDICRVCDFAPVGVVGHSAGAAIATRAVLDQLLQPSTLISINGALLPFPGLAGQTFPAMAKMLFLNPFVPRLFAMGVGGNGHRVERLLETTGSTIDQTGKKLYAELFRNPRHVAGALALMANWDLDELKSHLHRLKIPLSIIVGEEDGTIPATDAKIIAELVKDSHVVSIPHLGHLVHEEEPELVADHIRSALKGHMPKGWKFWA